MLDALPEILVKRLEDKEPYLHTGRFPFYVPYSDPIDCVFVAGDKDFQATVQ